MNSGLIFFILHRAGRERERSLEPICQTALPPKPRYPSASHVFQRQKAARPPPCHIQSHQNSQTHTSNKKGALYKSRTKAQHDNPDSDELPPDDVRTCINYLSVALLNKSVCQVPAGRIKMSYITRILKQTQAIYNRKERQILPGWNILWK